MQIIALKNKKNYKNLFVKYKKFILANQKMQKEF